MGHPLPDGLGKGAVPAAGQTAYPKGLADHRLVMPHKLVERLRAHAGNQGQQQHTGFQTVVKHRLRSVEIGGRREIANQPPVPNDGDFRVVHTGERIEALGPLLPGTGA